MRKVWKNFFWENHKLSKEGAPGWYQHLHRSLHLWLNGSISSHCMSNEPNNIQILGHQCLFQRRPCLIHQHFCLNMGVFLTSFCFSKVGCKYQILQPKAPPNTYMQKVPHTIKRFTTMSDYMEINPTLRLICLIYAWIYCMSPVLGANELHVQYFTARWSPKHNSKPEIYFSSFWRWTWSNSRCLNRICLFFKSSGKLTEELTGTS